MSNSLKANLAPLSLDRLGQTAAVISEVLEQGQGIRLGQSAVLSSKVHAFHAYSPECVQIMVNSDAGQVFYYRQDKGKIGHLDIFHECGMVDHLLVARYVCLALEAYRTLSMQQTPLMRGGLINPEFVDIQTATGGGRITGRLQGGQKLSVRRVHENHVHVALLLPQDKFHCLFYIMTAVETAIMDLGLELRCNEGISYVEAADCKSDLSPYADKTDSLLTNDPAAEVNQSTYQQSDDAGDMVPELAPDGGRVGSSPGSGTLPANKNCGQTFVGEEGSLQGGKQAKTYQRKSEAYKDIPVFSLKGLYNSYKQAVRQRQCRSGVGLYRRNLRKLEEFGSKSRICNQQVCSGGFDVTATISAAAERLLAEGITGRLQIKAPDIRYTWCCRQKSSDVCLLVDCSGSMAGSRLQAARYAAGEISKFGYSRLSLLIFQDKQAVVMRPFTTSRQQVLQAFAEIVPRGATPLALGLRYSLAYLKEQKVRKPLLVLITDGVPSKRYDENIQPLTEALAAAGEIKQGDCGFLCIGLDSTDGFLQKLTAAAGGVMYSLLEFEKQTVIV